MTPKEFCAEFCGACKEEDCCVDSEPSCALSRKLKIKLKSENEDCY